MPTTLVEPPASRPADQLMTLTQVGELVALRPTATKSLVRRPDFPPAVRLSQRVTRWWRSEVEAWLNDQRSTYQTVRTPGCPSLRRGPARRRH